MTFKDKLKTSKGIIIVGTEDIKTELQKRAVLHFLREEIYKRVLDDKDVTDLLQLEDTIICNCNFDVFPFPISS